MSFLSPHGRGKPRAADYPLPKSRSIPARAGETVRRPVYPFAGQVYPRTGGGNDTDRVFQCGNNGLSPHGRGKLTDGAIVYTDLRSIPARAGETSCGMSWSLLSRVYPRTGGGNSAGTGGRPSPPGLSPHGRGKLGAQTYPPGRGGSIPARAGETRGPCRLYAGTQVYPRTGGGNDYRRRPERQCEGLSPHGRGKLAGWFHPSWPGGSIPARAGETALDRAWTG